MLNAEYNNIEHPINGLLRTEQHNWLTPLNELTTPNMQWLVERSYPYEINHGQVTITEQQEHIGFNTLVPQRWDLSGWSSSGLYMNGLWHPQSPVERNEAWTIHLKTQETSWIILNGTMAQGSITWSGTGHAHDLAILSKVEIHETENHTVVSTRNGTKGQAARRMSVTRISQEPWLGCTNAPPIGGRWTTSSLAQRTCT